MPWNYRLVKYEQKVKSRFGEIETDISYGIHTAYYDEGTEPDSKPHSIGFPAATMIMDNPNMASFEDVLRKFRRAMFMPVLNFSDYHEPNQVIKSTHPDSSLP